MEAREYILRRSAAMEAIEPLIPEASTHEKSQLYLNRVNRHDSVHHVNHRL